MTSELDNYESAYGVLLPCKPSEFGEFIAGLLGKPQTLERRVPGAFIVGRDDIVNLYNLVDQRVHQQNEASLVQCTVRVIYNDDSSVLHNSLQAFVSYNEVTPIASTCVHVSWVYLVRFRNKQVPERQAIDVTFFGNDIGCRVDGPVFYSEEFAQRSLLIRAYNSRMTIRIQHTERTWGVDLDSLLAGALSQMVVPRKPLARMIYVHSGKIGWGVALILISAAAATIVFSSEFFLDSYLEKAKSLGASSSSVDALASKIDFLIEVISTGAWPRFMFAAVTFLLITVALATILGTWVAAKAEIPPRSFVLLSRSAEEDKRKWDQRIKRDWLLFGLSLVASVAAGVLSSWLSANYFTAGVITAL